MLNNDGGFTCACDNGYLGDGTSGNCINENECATGNNNCLSSKATCTDNDGGFTYECNVGYDGDGIKKGEGGTGCSDIDECILKTDTFKNSPIAPTLMLDLNVVVLMVTAETVSR